MHSGTVRSGPVSVRKMKKVAVLVTVAVGQTGAEKSLTCTVQNVIRRTVM